MSGTEPESGTDPKLVAELNAIEDRVLEGGSGGGGAEPTGGPYKPTGDPVETNGGPYKPTTDEPVAATT